MLFTTLLAPLALLALPFTEAKYRPKTHNVIVGGAAGLVYTPSVVYAQPGDTVKFKFQFKNHTVTQSSFDYPCTPLHGGFTSGFNPVAPDAKKFPTFKVDVHDTDPIWVHCEQVDHCPSGMVFAINPPRRGNTFHKFLKKAKSLAYDDYKKRSEVDDEPEEVSGVEQRDIISRITGRADAVSESDE
ncbi:hypothetical protein FS837_001274 [Tulasnella sp. UAMH 9824]|nr:hypothetical protein FS837_001274 [Tulasnella sp. UAMH 9824]